MAVGGLESGLRAFKARMEAAALTGANKAAMRFLDDCTKELPATPIKEGTLRGSGSAFVNTDCVKTGGGASAATELGELSVKAGELVITVGFNEPYAAYQHEGIRQDKTHAVKKYSDPEAGPKFIEDKLAYAEDYVAIVAAEMKGVPGA